MSVRAVICPLANTQPHAAFAALIHPTNQYTLPSFQQLLEDLHPMTLTDLFALPLGLGGLGVGDSVNWNYLLHMLSQGHSRKLS